jgi:glyoxylase-like metal-dependent hydrolase (beta-lactamase superfamily II)
VSRSRLVLAPNPGPMTLEGTNTWLLAEPGSPDAVVVDPGPDDAGHLAAVLRVAADAGLTVREILLTHGHPDHAEGARTFAGLTGAPVRALDPAHRLGGEGLAGGSTVVVGGLEIQVVSTPGHTSDSLSFLLPAEGALLTGDTVLGRGSTLVAHPDGRLGDYLASLQRLAGLAAAGALRTILPGHGPVVTDPAAVVASCLAHRAGRLGQVERALAAGARTPAEVVAVVYADVDPVLWPAAELNVLAQLEYLEQRRDAP